MADTVRYLLEEMIPELEDLEKRGLFSKGEIREVVKKRTNFEYLLKRRATLKADYLRYVEFESKFEVLRRHRKRSLNLTDEKASISDHSVSRRIHFIYERATRKFKGDLRLWLRYFEFCRASGSTKSLSKIISRALQMHPTAAGLWSYAAAYEFESLHNPDAARALMQRGLRMCKGSERLWLEYFRMELLYAHKLETRRKILDLTMDTIGAGGAGTDDTPASTASAAVRSGAVACVVVSKAAEGIQGKPAFLARFLDILEMFEGAFPAVKARVVQEIMSRFPRDPASRARVAAAAGDESLALAIEAFEAAVGDVPSAEMFELYARYLRERVDSILSPGSEGGTEGKGSEGGEEGAEGVAGELTEGARAEALGVIRRALKVFERAAGKGCLTEATGVEWPALLARCGRPVDALAAARDACEALPDCAAVWSQRLQLEGQRVAIDDPEDAWEVDQLFEVALKRVPIDEAPGLWSQALEFHAASGLPCFHLAPLVARMLAVRVEDKGIALGIAQRMLELMWFVEGPGTGRDAYNAWLPLPGAGAPLHLAVADLEQSLGDVGSPGAVRKVLEDGVARHSDSPELWLALYRLEVGRAGEAVESAAAAGRVHWRAMKALEGEALVAFSVGAQEVLKS